MTDHSAVTNGHDKRIDQILDIVAAETSTDRASLHPDAKIEDIGISSLEMTLAIFKLETVFDIEIPVIAERAGTEFGTVGELVAHVIAVLDRSPVSQMPARSAGGVVAET